ncbi:Probable beta-1,3-galactosyltransferase 14 [Linum perenne]
MAIKSFNARPFASAASRRSTAFVVIFSICIGISGFLFGLTALFASPSSRRCGAPRSVKVSWETNPLTTELKSDGGGGLLLDGERTRHKVMVFVGIQTGFGSSGRRRSLRKTWMPSDPQGLQRLEESTGLAFRFVIGKTKDKRRMAELQEEVEAYDDFLLLDIEEQYNRLSTLLAKERPHSRTYLGCMKKGPVFGDPKLKCFRMFSNEDVTIGSWMLAMNVNHEDNRELCATDCSPTSISIWDIPKCSGLCNPETRLLELHNREECSQTPTVMADDD